MSERITDSHILPLLITEWVDPPSPGCCWR